MFIDGARWELDADALFAAPLTVQRFNTDSGSDTHVLRMSCSFSPRGRTLQRALQRYINLTQRREKFLLH